MNDADMALKREALARSGLGRSGVRSGVA